MVTTCAKPVENENGMARTLRVERAEGSIPIGVDSPTPATGAPGRSTGRYWRPPARNPDDC